jgi:hypothetical protein
MSGVLLFLIAAVAAADELLLGGWTAAAVTPDSRAVLARALSTTNVCVNSIWSLRTQVAAGTNYEFQIDGCRGEEGGSCARPCASPRRFLVRVFEQPWTHTTLLTAVAEH